MVFACEMPSTWLQSFSSFLIYILTPFLDRFWGWQARRKREPTSVTKRSLGSVLMRIGFALRIWIINDQAPWAKAYWLWLCACTLFCTVGEIYLSPIGPSFVTKVAPARIVSMMMGVWLLSSFFGNCMAGYLGSYYETMRDEKLFGLMVTLSLVSAAFLILMSNVFHGTLHVDS